MTSMPRLLASAPRVSSSLPLSGAIPPSALTPHPTSATSTSFASGGAAASSLTGSIPAWKRDWLLHVGGGNNTGTITPGA
jgi:hypothetical protein